MNWTSQTCPNNDWSSVTYGNGLFVAVSYNGTANRIMTSATATLQVNNDIKSSTLMEILEGEFTLGNPARVIKREEVDNDISELWKKNKSNFHH